MCWEAPVYTTEHFNIGSHPEGKLTHFEVHHFELPIPLHPEIIRNWGNTWFFGDRNTWENTERVFRNSDEHEPQSL